MKRYVLTQSAKKAILARVFVPNRLALPLEEKQ